MLQSRGFGNRTGEQGGSTQIEYESKHTAQAWLPVEFHVTFAPISTAEVQEELSSRLDALAGRLGRSESAAQEQPTPAPKAELTPTPEEEAFFCNQDTFRGDHHKCWSGFV